MRIAIVFFTVLQLIGANTAEAQAVTVLRLTQKDHNAAVSLGPIDAAAGLRSRPQALATSLEGRGARIRERSPLRDLKLARMGECKASPRRVVLGATLGLLAGTAIGVVYGAAGHPGLPHIGEDVPSELEYTPLFALGGAVLGGILGGRPPRECPTP